MIKIKTYIVKVKPRQQNHPYTDWLEALIGKEIEVARSKESASGEVYYSPVEDAYKTDQINDDLFIGYSLKGIGADLVEFIREVESDDLIAENSETITVERGEVLERFEYALLDRRSRLDFLMTPSENDAYIAASLEDRAVLRMLARGFRFRADLRNGSVLFERKRSDEEIAKMIDALCQFVRVFDETSKEFYMTLSAESGESIKMIEAREVLRKYL